MRGKHSFSFVLGACMAALLAVVSVACGNGSNDRPSEPVRPDGLRDRPIIPDDGNAGGSAGAPDASGGATRGGQSSAEGGRASTGAGGRITIGTAGDGSGGDGVTSPEGGAGGDTIAPPGPCIQLQSFEPL